MMSLPFVPKQVLGFYPSYQLKSKGGLTRSVADQVAAKFVLPLSASSRVHDNGCGTGEVARALIDNGSLPAGATIVATTLIPHFLASYTRVSKKVHRDL
jgi:hypothetical protein